MVVSVFFCAAVIILLLIWYLRRRNSYFTYYNIPFPEPSLVVGNLLAAHNRTLHEAIQGWTKKYGKVFGYFEGGTPVLVVSDLDMLQEIFVKRFGTFHSRKNFPLHKEPDTEKEFSSDLTMFMARGSRWKRLRAIINPTFSAAKMKQMVTFMNDSTEVFMNKLSDAESRDFDVYSYYQRLTMDVIGRCALGVVSKCQQEETDEFLELCRDIMNATTKPGPLTYLSVFFPELNSLWRQIDSIKLGQNLRPIIDYRREHPQEASKSVDLLQLLLDAESEDFSLESDGITAPAAFVTSDTGIGRELKWKLEKKLVTEEIIQQCILFLIAGFETTSTALAYATYLLALNPDVQRKLQDEVDDVFPDELQSVRPTYESVGKLQYMEYVINETLRLYPVASPVQARTCTADCTINGTFIPSGLAVCADVWSIHYDESIWGAEPDKFKPERWESELRGARHPMCWLPFGAGPRMCIGMRFAMLEQKIALARILKKYSFRASAKTQIPLKVKEGASTTPANGVYIKLERRNNDV